MFIIRYGYKLYAKSEKKHNLISDEKEKPVQYVT
jgi:hypothetical protein